jgi:DnaK suppressor protein
MTTISTNQAAATADLDPLVGTRLALESAWRRKVDEVIVLSMAFCELTPGANGILADRGVQVSSGLRARREHAYDELAAIEDAIARIDAGTYGLCAGCSEAMPDEWLADTPEVRYCPDCSLRLVDWPQPGLPGAPHSVTVQWRRRA